MNRERLKKVRDFIAKNPSQFDYDTWLRSINGGIDIFKHWAGRGDCRTVGCVAGWTCVLFLDSEPSLSYAEAATELLDLSDGHALWLFEPGTYLREYSSCAAELQDLLSREQYHGIEVTEAIARLDHLIAGQPISSFESPLMAAYMERV